MFWKKPERPSREQLLIEKCCDFLDATPVDDDAFAIAVKNMNLLKEGLPENKEDRVSMNTLFTVGAYAALSLVVIGAELFGHSITSRAFNALPFKPKF